MLHRYLGGVLYYTSLPGTLGTEYLVYVRTSFTWLAHLTLVIVGPWIRLYRYSPYLPACLSLPIGRYYFLPNYNVVGHL